jgi:hypothetical protein
MGVAIDTIHSFVANPGAGGANTAASPGDSLTVRNAKYTAPVFLEGIWRDGTAAGVVKVTSPLLHDNLQAIRLRGLAADSSRLTPWEFAQPVEPQDNLTVNVTGGAAETDGALLQFWYGDLPGSAAILKMPGDILGNVEQFLGQEVAVTASATIGTWVDTAINATFDTLKGNRYYAVLGFLTDTLLSGVAVKGPATNNFRVGAGGSTIRVETKDIFLRMSEKTGRPHIPVFNSADKAGTFVSVVDKAASTTANINLMLALLPASWTP